MVWLAATGLALQVLGTVLIAVDLWEPIKKLSHGVAIGAEAIDIAAGFGTATVQTDHEPTIEERLTALEQHQASLQERVALVDAEAQKRLNEEVGKLREQLGKRVDLVSGRLDFLAQGGKRFRGLRLVWWGTVFVLVGLMTSSVATIVAAL